MLSRISTEMLSVAKAEAAEETASLQRQMMQEQEFIIIAAL